MPMATITGIDYDRITRLVEEELDKPVLHLPGKSLSGDWLDGYAETLLTIAKGIDVSDAKADKKKIAIIGYMMDRNEAEHHANFDELTQLLQCIPPILIVVSTNSTDLLYFSSWLFFSPELQAKNKTAIKKTSSFFMIFSF